MEHNNVGQTELKIPRLVFGTTSLGNLFQEVPEATKLATIKEVFAHVPKPVAIDSAGKYGAGLALEVMGRSLSRLGIAPDEVVISNKLAWRRIPLTTPEPTFEPGAWMGLQHDAEQDISYEGILRCWEDGLALLGGSYKTQMVSVHDPDEYLDAATSEADRARRFTDILEAYRALAELKARGEVVAIGVGAKKWRSIREISDHVDLDWAMFANSLTLYTHPPELVAFMDKLGQQGTSIINSAVFNAGFLTGGAFFDYRKLDPGQPADQEKFAWRERFFAICKQYAVAPAEACVQFGLSHPAVTNIALNTSQPARVGQNLKLLTATIPPEFWAAIREAGLVADSYAYWP